MFLAVGLVLAAALQGVAQERTFGGPEGVEQRLQTDLDPEALYPRVSPLPPYFDWKPRLAEEHGLSFGLSAILLYQGASDVRGRRVRRDLPVLWELDGICP